MEVYLMNNKIISLLIVLIMAISIASVCAVELTKENDFDGKFKMNITGNETFIEMSDGTGQSEFSSDKSWTNNESVMVCVYEKSVDDVVSMLRSNSGFMDDPTTDGNLTILQDNTAPDDAPYSVEYFVGVQSSDNKTAVFVGCDDLDTAKAYANTVKF